MEQRISSIDPARPPPLPDDSGLVCFVLLARLHGVAAIALVCATLSNVALGATLPAYPAQPGDCYVLLKNQPSVVQSSDAPLCLATLRNFNKFCGEPPQYDRRKRHLSSEELREPD